MVIGLISSTDDGETRPPASAMDEALNLCIAKAGMQRSAFSRGARLLLLLLLRRALIVPSFLVFGLFLCFFFFFLLVCVARHVPTIARFGREAFIRWFLA